MGHSDSWRVSLTMFYLNMVDYRIIFLLLSTWIFFAEQVRGVIPSHFYSLTLEFSY